MSTPNSTSYIFVVAQVAVYMGIPILFAGLVGEILNIIVFLSLKTFRENSCAFYLTVMSFVNIGQLLTSLLPQIMIGGFYIDWTKTLSWYCKFRIYILQLCTLMSCTCMCLATIDQFFATCFTPCIQQLSNIKLARILSLMYLFIWIIHGIPYLLYLNLIELLPTHEHSCSITNKIFQVYFDYGFVTILAGFLPVAITILFGLLAYHNVKKSVYAAVPLIRRELDKQLTVMVLVEVVFNCFTTIPYIILYIIMLNPKVTNGSFLYGQLQIASAILFNTYFLHYAVSITCLENYQSISFLESILHIYVCFGTISSSINLCFI
jgi:hypothetical protein